MLIVAQSRVELVAWKEFGLNSILGQSQSRPNGGNDHDQMSFSSSMNWPSLNLDKLRSIKSRKNMYQREHPF